MPQAQQLPEKNSMGEFYRQFFPEDCLERSFSNDVSVTVFLPMIEEEELKLTFEHPPNLNKLRSQEKADLVVINNMTKLIFVADFSSHYFNKVSSLSTEVKKFLSKIQDWT